MGRILEEGLAKLSGGAPRLLSRVELPGVDMCGSLVRFGE
jgi:hypothetical protein